jgi:hypothetical protein
MYLEEIMDWLTALITIGSVVVGSSLTFLFDYLKTKSNNKITKNNRNIENLYIERRNAYIEFLDTLPEAYHFIVTTKGSLNRYSNALNKIYLVGSPKLIKALIENNFTINNKSENLLHHENKPLKVIINIMREDLGYCEELEDEISCLHTD